MVFGLSFERPQTFMGKPLQNADVAGGPSQHSGRLLCYVTDGSVFTPGPSLHKSYASINYGDKVKCEREGRVEETNGLLQ